ncbi:hypothetical protein K438DRAFT_1759310 [Mycena galopus ATCC 62051]|nr:hypothetical protein K438DRAFT_1759310 [Mycena galopus ATCC 62051]
MESWFNGFGVIFGFRSEAEARLVVVKGDLFFPLDPYSPDSHIGQGSSHALLRISHHTFAPRRLTRRRNGSRCRASPPVELNEKFRTYRTQVLRFAASSTANLRLAREMLLLAAFLNKILPKNEKCGTRGASPQLRSVCEVQVHELKYKFFWGTLEILMRQPQLEFSPSVNLRGRLQSSPDVKKQGGRKREDTSTWPKRKGKEGRYSTKQDTHLRAIHDQRAVRDALLPEAPAHQAREGPYTCGGHEHEDGGWTQPGGEGIWTRPGRVKEACLGRYQGERETKKEWREGG